MVLTLQKMKPNEEKQVIVIFWPDSLTVVHSITCRSCSTTVRAAGLERREHFFVTLSHGNYISRGDFVGESDPGIKPVLLY